MKEQRNEASGGGFLPFTVLIWVSSSASCTPISTRSGAHLFPLARALPAWTLSRTFISIICPVDLLAFCLCLLRSEVLSKQLRLEPE